MANIKAPNLWAEQFANLDDPTPRDIDPEENGAHFDYEDDSESVNSEDQAAAAREHYIDVGKSKLRKPRETLLGPRYMGSTIRRDDLRADESDDDPFGSGASQVEQSGEDSNAVRSEEAYDTSVEPDEMLKEKLNGTNGASHVSEEEEDGEDSDDIEMAVNGSMSDSHGDGNQALPKKFEASELAELRRMMADEQKTVISTISKAAKADVAKGKAVQHQRSTFDSLLNTRIRLQKALVATNSLSAEAPSTESSVSSDEAVQSAEQAALSLWTTLNDLRQSLQANSTEKLSASRKRPFSPTLSTPASTIWARMQEHESTSLPHRRATLSKWSSRVHVSSTLQTRNALSSAISQQSLTSVLDQQLSAPNNARLVARTRVPRSCAPLQAAKGVNEDSNIYDDADFYALLLRELVDQRMSSTNRNTTSLNDSDLPSAITSSLKAPKIRKQVDTKASKGRKMRYTVHEKLQNFMAPESRGTWGERQVGELFGSLLGARVMLGEDDGDEDEEDVGTAGLRLFGGTSESRDHIP